MMSVVTPWLIAVLGVVGALAAALVGARATLKSREPRQAELRLHDATIAWVRRSDGTDLVSFDVSVENLGAKRLR
jgi:hypothetical protein